MAIVYTEEVKKRKYLFYIFLIVILVLLSVLWFGVIKEKEVPPPKGVFPEKTVVEKLPEEFLKKLESIFEILGKQSFEKFLPFEEIRPFEEEIGRENPFIPYKVEEI